MRRRRDGRDRRELALCEREVRPPSGSQKLPAPAEDEQVTARDADPAVDAVALVVVLLASPVEWVAHARWRRNGLKRRHDPEELVRPALGRPCRHAQAATASADAPELARDGGVVRREDRTDVGGDDVERAVLVGELLGVPDLEAELEALVGREPRRGLDQVGREVDG